MKEIEGSSNIEAIGHENGILTVRFCGGATYDYPDFPAELHAKWLEHHESGGSVGKWFHQNVKPHYEGRKREPQ